VITTLALAQRGGDVRRVEGGHGGRHRRHLRLPKRGPEAAVVGLDLDPPELVGLGDEAKLADVELVADELVEPLDRRALASGRDHDRGPQRLADLQLRLAACRQPEPDGLAGDRHVAVLELEGSRSPGSGKSHRWTLSSAPSRLS
jgi:hypothetical protein